MGSQQGQNMGSQQGQNTGPQQGMEMGPQQGMEMGPPQQGGQGYPPSMPTDMYKPMKPPMHWIPYYDAGTLETGEEGGVILADFEIPAELNGAYRISMLMRTDHTYPYYSYNWFYNNSAIVCEP